MLFLRLLAVLFFAFSPAFTSEKVTLQLNWKHQFEFAGYYAALHKGYYKEAGLDVTIKEADGSFNPIESVLKHKAQYGVGNSDILLYRHKGYEPVLLAVIFQHSSLCLLALESSKIKTPSDLIGKNILIEHNSNEIMGWLKRNAINTKQVNIVNEKYDIQKLIDGKFDAITAYTPIEPYTLQKRGIKYKLFHPVETQIDFYGDNLFTTEKELSEHPARVKAFREASLRGWKYAMSHPVEIARLITKEYRTPEALDALMYEAKAMQELMETDIMEPGYYSEERWRHIAETYAELGMLPQEISFNGFFYKDRAEKYPSWLVDTAYTMAALFIVSVIVIWNFYRLTKRLRANEERYHGMYENAPVVFILWDTDLRILQWNARAESIFGYTKKEILGKKGINILVPPDEQRLINSKFQTMLNSKEDFSSTNKNKTKNGELITCEWINTPLLDADGNIESLVSLAVDVTEKEKILARLKNKEDSFEHMINMAPFPIVITDYTTSELMFANQATAEALKETKSSLLSSLAQDYWYDMTDRELYIKELLKKGYIENFETRFKRKNGEIFWIQMSAVRIVSDNRETAFISFLDIDAKKKLENELKENEQRYRLLAENADDVIWTIDTNGKFTYISPSVERLRGYTPDELINQSISSALTPKSAKSIEEDIKLLLEKKEVRLKHIELEQPRKDGSIIYTEAVITPIKDKNGKLTSILGITRDITERKKLKEELYIKNAAVDFAANGFLITDIDGIVEYINPAFTEITGYTKEDILGKSPHIMSSGQHKDSFWVAFWSTISSGKSWKGELINKNKKGEIYHQLTAVAPVKNEQGEIFKYVSIVQDITKRKETEQKLERLAHYDSLTSLPNRAMFFKKIDALLNGLIGSEGAALMFVDLDGFKDINDTYGHETGDALLAQVSKEINDSLSSDDFAARMGGDEFTVVVKMKQNSKNLESIAQELVDTISKERIINDTKLQVGASIGISIYPQTANDIKTLLSTADQAMYEAKAKGKNRFFIFEG